MLERLSRIETLKQRRIIGLGKKAWNVLHRTKIPDGAGPIWLKRGIGDSYFPADSLTVLRSLAMERNKRH